MYIRPKRRDAFTLLHAAAFFALVLSSATIFASGLINYDDVLPRHWDVRRDPLNGTYANGEKKNVDNLCIAPPGWQRSCASSYAMAVVDSLSDRLCLMQLSRSNSATTALVGRLSLQQILSCVHANQSSCCESDSAELIRKAWKYVLANGGLVTARCAPDTASFLGYCNETVAEAICAPTNRSNQVFGNVDAKDARSANFSNEDVCVGRDGFFHPGNKSSSTMTFYRFRARPGSLSPRNMTAPQIQRSLFSFGPVSSALRANRALLEYPGGGVVFDGSSAIGGALREVTSDEDNLIASANNSTGAVGVRIVGWGSRVITSSAHAVPYWIVLMPFGTEWGDAGEMLVKRGSDVGGIESSAVVAQADLISLQGCLPGQAFDLATYRCNFCPPGQFSRTGESCALCPTGYFAAKSGSTNCEPCESSQICQDFNRAEHDGRVSCACPAGSPLPVIVDDSGSMFSCDQPRLFVYNPAALYDSFFTTMWPLLLLNLVVFTCLIPLCTLLSCCKNSSRRWLREYVTKVRVLKASEKRNQFVASLIGFGWIITWIILAIFLLIYLVSLNQILTSDLQPMSALVSGKMGDVPQLDKEPLRLSLDLHGWPDASSCNSELVYWTTDGCHSKSRVDCDSDVELNPKVSLRSSTSRMICSVSIEFPTGTQFDKIFSAELRLRTPHPFYTQLVVWEMQSGQPNLTLSDPSHAFFQVEQNASCPITELPDFSCDGTLGGSLIRGVIQPRPGELLLGNLSVTAISMLHQINSCSLADTDLTTVVRYSNVTCSQCAVPSHRKLTPFSTYADRVSATTWSAHDDISSVGNNNLTVTIYIEKNTVYQRTQFRRQALAMGQIVFSLFVVLLGLRTYHIYAVDLFELLRRKLPAISKEYFPSCYRYASGCTCFDDPSTFSKVAKDVSSSSYSSGESEHLPLLLDDHPN